MAPSPSPNKQSVNLDFLRATGLLTVCAVHYADTYFGITSSDYFFGRLGQCALMCFFVHTALVLMWSMERSEKAGPHIYLPFYVRRFFRLYPLAIVLVLLAFFWDARWFPPSLWQNLTLTEFIFPSRGPAVPATVVPLWSLAVEMEMYLFLPAMFLFFRDRPASLLMGVWALSIPLCWLQPRLGPEFILLKYLPCFIGGVLAWRLMRNTDRRRLPGWLWPVVLAGVASLWGFFSRAWPTFSIAMVGLALGTIIPLFRDISAGPVATASSLLTRYSYGGYLWHFPIILFVLRETSHDDRHFRFLPLMPVIHHYARPIDLLLIVIAVSVCSIATYHLIEEPGIELGRRLAKRLARRVDSPDAPEQLPRDTPAQRPAVPQQQW
jgi:peptidoglycan/LPS O-acetylase OafA/YrhL